MEDLTTTATAPVEDVAESLHVALTADSRRVWSLRPDDVLAINRVAQTVLQSESFEDAEQPAISVSGASEIDCERARRPACSRRPTTALLILLPC